MTLVASLVRLDAEEIAEEIELAREDAAEEIGFVKEERAVVEVKRVVGRAEIVVDAIRVALLGAALLGTGAEELGVAGEEGAEGIITGVDGDGMTDGAGPEDEGTGTGTGTITVFDAEGAG